MNLKNWQLFYYIWYITYCIPSTFTYTSYLAMVSTLVTPVDISPQGPQQSTAENFMMKTIEDEMKNTKRHCNVINLFRGFFIALGGWVTCCWCCGGCCGACKAYSGSVKYDSPEYMDLDPVERRTVNLKEHVNVIARHKPASCFTCCCCLGYCGKAGPMTVGAGILELTKS